MPRREKKTFFVYGQGSSLDQLCLGHLVLRDYANPLTVRHCKHPRLSDQELKEHAYITELAPNFKYKRESGFNLAPGIDVTDIVTLKFSSALHKVRVLTASGGHRVVLKDPSRFFAQKVLANQNSVDTLHKWLTTLSIFELRIRPPKIWLLTGIYSLKDGASTELDEVKLGTEAAISSTLMTALTGAPVGPSLEARLESTNELSVPMKDELVWAAQYQQLNLKDALEGVRDTLVDMLGMPSTVSSITVEDANFSKGTVHASAPTRTDTKLDFIFKYLDHDAFVEEMGVVSSSPLENDNAREITTPALSASQGSVSEEYIVGDGSLAKEGSLGDELDSDQNDQHFEQALELAESGQLGPI